MFASALHASFRILVFRAGPQDFPYDPRGRLTAACIAFAVLVNTLLFAMLVPPARALLSSLINLAMLALFTRLTLVLRKQENRFQQTFNSLLATTSLVTLLMLPFFAQLAPVWSQIMEELRKNPDFANHPEQWPAMPVVAENVFALLCLWQLIIIFRIFHQAAGLKAVLALLALLFFMVLASSLSLGGAA